MFGHNARLKSFPIYALNVYQCLNTLPLLEKGMSHSDKIFENMYT